MLTRLKVSGFKNLVDVDVRFGPFTCIAGANGTGKSNLFDAIQFLSALAGGSLREATEAIRSDGERADDGRSLFHRVGDKNDDEMSFEVEMIIPKQGRDELGQEIEADHTFLRYALTLMYHKGAFSSGFSAGYDVNRVQIVKEELITLSDVHFSSFPLSSTWSESVFSGVPTIEPVIVTHVDNDQKLIMIQRENVERIIEAQNLPRTVLSSDYVANNPIALLARNEMQSWRILRLEPSAIREPTSPNKWSLRLPTNGGQIASLLNFLSSPIRVVGTDTFSDSVLTTNQVAGRLSELIDDVHEIWLDVDDKRDLVTLYVKDWQGASHPARDLSDGTLRFLALVIIELNPFETGVICLEEPENGIHPARISALLRLLQDIATDTHYPVADDNPFRQVIVTTHSPAVVQQVPDDALLFAELKSAVRNGKRFKRASFSYLSDTWRAKLDPAGVVAKGNLLAYLNPVPRSYDQDNGFSEQRVIDRPDLQPYVPGVIAQDD